MVALLLHACLLLIKKPTTICLTLAKMQLQKLKKNLKFLKGNFTYKSGDCFEPWEGQKFDLIINDVSGISSRVSKISPWFKNVSIDKSTDGISLKKL